MSTLSHLALQTSLYEALTDSVDLMAMISGVFDHVPQQTEYPYITLGDIHSQDWSSKTTSGMQHSITLYVYSRSGGRKEAALIMDEIYGILHAQELSVSGFSLISLRFTASDIMLEGDGATYRGMMRFRALLEAD